MFWMHTDTTGKRIRYLLGHQIMNVNTLKIYTTTSADSGYYVCKVAHIKDVDSLANLSLHEPFLNDVDVIDWGQVQLKVRGNICHYLKLYSNWCLPESHFRNVA